jgi:hypothetical protein
MIRRGSRADINFPRFLLLRLAESVVDPDGADSGSALRARTFEHRSSGHRVCTVAGELMLRERTPGMSSADDSAESNASPCAPIL